MKIVSCPPTVQVVVNRPDTKYQLGFSVQNGMVSQLTAILFHYMAELVHGEKEHSDWFPKRSVFCYTDR